MYLEVDVILHAIRKPYGSEKFWSLKKYLTRTGIKCHTISTVANILQYIGLTLFGMVGDIFVSFMFIGLITEVSVVPYEPMVVSIPCTSSSKKLNIRTFTWSTVCFYTSIISFRILKDIKVSPRTLMQLLSKEG